MLPERVRVDESAADESVFQYFRTLGLVSNKTPFAMHNLGTAYFVTTCVGKSFQIYDVSPHYDFEREYPNPS